MGINDLKRGVAKIDRPEVSRGHSDAHRVRQLVPPGNWAATDPFLLLMEDWFPVGVFDRHPHRGIETVTYVIEGSIEHYDNHGNKGVIGAGDALWLTAGRGLIHNEVPGGGKPVHTLQLWINLPRAHKLVQAGYQELRAAEVPSREEPGADIRVFSGQSGPAKAATRNYAPVTMIEICLQPHAEFEQDIPAGFNAFAVVLEGTGKVGTTSTEVSAGDVAWLSASEDTSTVGLSGGEEGPRLILFAGQPLGEPVAARGPFVMNTAEELNAGFAEFRAQGDRFGL